MADMIIRYFYRELCWAHPVNFAAAYEKASRMVEKCRRLKILSWDEVCDTQKELNRLRYEDPYGITLG